MKKNLKKLSSLVVAFVLVFSLSVSAFAADISGEKAKQIALNDAGVKASDVSFVRVVADYDDGVKYYDVNFYVEEANGDVYEYDYDVRVSDGKILQREVEKEKSASRSVNNGNDIGEEAAKAKALGHFGLKEADVRFYEIKRDYDDGVLVYEFEFCKPYDVKYSCEVSAADGRVYDAEKESVRELFDKIELFFEVLFFKLFNL